VFIVCYISCISCTPSSTSVNIPKSACPKSCDTFGITPYKGGSLFKRYSSIINSTGLYRFTTKNMTIECEPDVGILTRQVWNRINEKVTNHSLTFGITTRGVPYGIVRYIDLEFNSNNGLPKDWRSYVSFYHVWFPKVIILQPTVIWRFLKNGPESIECEQVTYNIDDSDFYFIKLLKRGLVK